jgi:hypothetical protein
VRHTDTQGQRDIHVRDMHMVRVTHAFGGRRVGGKRHAQGEERDIYTQEETHTTVSVFPSIAEFHFLCGFLFTNVINLLPFRFYLMFR